jgi:hypothetical protein
MIDGRDISVVRAPRPVIHRPTAGRIAVLAILLSVGATFGTAAGFTADSAVVGGIWGLGAIFGSAIVLTLVFRWSWLQSKTMKAMHHISGD